VVEGGLDQSFSLHCIAPLHEVIALLVPGDSHYKSWNLESEIKVVSSTHVNDVERKDELTNNGCPMLDRLMQLHELGEFKQEVLRLCELPEMFEMIVEGFFTVGH
jgi:hypothetical protein